MHGVGPRGFSLKLTGLTCWPVCCRVHGPGDPGLTPCSASDFFVTLAKYLASLCLIRHFPHKPQNFGILDGKTFGKKMTNSLILFLESPT